MEVSALTLNHEQAGGLPATGQHAPQQADRSWRARAWGDTLKAWEEAGARRPALR